MKKIFFTALALAHLSLYSQKKVLDHTDFDIWNTIEGATISPDGAHVMYALVEGEKNSYLKIKDDNSKEVFSYSRASDGAFSFDSNYAVFIIKAWKDSILELKRRKVKKENLPKDSLGIVHLKSKELRKFPDIKSYKLPEKWSGHLAYLSDHTTKDSKEEEEEETKKKPGDKNGYQLNVLDLNTGQRDSFPFVTDYIFAKNGKSLAFVSTGSTKESESSIYVLDFEKDTLRKVHSSKKATYGKLAFSKTGSKLSFVVDADTTKAFVRPTSLFLWESGDSIAKKIADKRSTSTGFHPSIYKELVFSEDDTKLYYGLTKPRVEPNTLLTDEEIVNVEVWTYDEPRLYTVQEIQIKNDSIKAYQAVVELDASKRIIPLASETYPEIELGKKGNANISLLHSSKPYDLPRQWTAQSLRDYALINHVNGQVKEVFKGMAGEVHLSPNASYVYGFDEKLLSWFTYSIKEDKMVYLTKDQIFMDELNDTPSPPEAYGRAGWLKEDEAIILYDRYDLWLFDPESGSSERLTKGREEKTVYRYIALDPEKEYLEPSTKWLLSSFNEIDKSAGFASYNLKDKQLKILQHGDYRYSKPVKALLSDKILYTKESFTEFPNLYISKLDLKNSLQISNANPQQEEFNWGTIELVHWNSLDGEELTGMLVKPENFDPKKKYPMIVNFYEKSSDRLHYHRNPYPGRSTINYSFYASRGYLIFNPDVTYRIGYPGESAYNCVIPGVTSLIEKGFVDPGRIGVQGHSWGGFQIAHLVTKTDIFKAAEAGAPVPNMISAYGGIRWWSGLSRQFQYEHTQSRIGGTPWEYPMRYIENSPIFNIDKINTPLLIMHNDADGHVPWYQGIEFFVSLRRLGKPSWFLNYNDEPHWPLKLQNRKDFNIRLAQFFDHYLKDAPKPSWMIRGVPAMEKGIRQGYELQEEK